MVWCSRGARARRRFETAHPEESYTFEARVREKLGDAAFARAAAEGAALGYEEALAEAQAWLEDPDTAINCSRRSDTSSDDR